MAKTILIDEIHVTIRIPANLPKNTASSIIRILKRKHFQTKLHNAIDAVFQRHATLRAAKITISR